MSPNMAAMYTTEYQEQDVWEHWVAPTFSTQTTYTPIDTTWVAWCTMQTPTITYTNQQIWQGWIMDTGTGATTQAFDPWPQWMKMAAAYQLVATPVRTPTPEEVEANRLAAERRRIEQEKAAEARAAAAAKARVLLRSLLDEEQLRTFEQEEKVHVIGSHGRRYCINTPPGKTAGNIDVLDEAGEKVAQLCIHLYGGEPDADNWIAQKLAIETDEDAFLKVAIVQRGKVPPAPEAPGTRSHRRRVREPLAA